MFPFHLVQLLLVIATTAWIGQVDCDEIITATTDDCILKGFPATSPNILPTGNNPYGMVVIPETVGNFAKGDLLISNWNDPTNNFFGQGNLITQIRNHVVIRTLMFTPVGNCLDPAVIITPPATGLGFTMAMAYIGGGKIIQCSLPINFDMAVAPTNANGTLFPPHPGCCAVINDKGVILATFKGNGINGPWGATAVIKEEEEKGGRDGKGNKQQGGLHNNDDHKKEEENNHKRIKVTLFLSSVLGPLGNVLGVNNGIVTRYTFILPREDYEWVSGSSDTNTGTLGPATTIVSGLTSTPVTISGGTVGPSGLAILDETLLVIADTLGGGTPGAGQLLSVGDAPLTCCGTGSNRCRVTLFAASGGNPIGINWAPIPRGKFALLVSDGGDGFQRQFNDHGTEICFITGDPVGAGTLFNILSVPFFDGKTHIQQVAFVDDNLNSVRFLSPYMIQEKPW